MFVLFILLKKYWHTNKLTAPNPVDHTTLLADG